MLQSLCLERSLENQLWSGRQTTADPLWMSLQRLQIKIDYSFHPEYSQPSSSARFLKSDSPGGRHCWHVFLPKFVPYLWHTGQFVDDSIFKGAVFYIFVLKYIIDIKWATGTNTWKLQDIVSCFCFLGLERWVDPFLSVRNVSSNSRCTYFQNHIRVESVPSVPHWPVSDIWQAPHLDEGQSCQYIHVVLHLRSIHSHFITFMVNTFTFMVKKSHFITVTVNTFTFYYIFCTFEGATLTMVNHVRPARLRLLLSSQASPYFRRKSLQTALSSNFPCERVSKKWKKCYYRTGKMFL